MLPAPGVSSEQVQYAMDWVHYLSDPPTTEWGKLRASNGHPEPYGVRYFQIDNEPMNNGFTPDKYAEIVNVYGGRLREIAPGARIVACGQKRSNDKIWSEEIIDLAGKNFDVVGVHNYEYEPEGFETGLRRIGTYLSKLRDYIRGSKHPHIEIGVLEWNLSRTYDWRAGLHAAGSLILYEQPLRAAQSRVNHELPGPADAEHDRRSDLDVVHLSRPRLMVPWLGVSGGEALSRTYAERRLASTSGTFPDIPNRKEFFDEIVTMKPEDWRPGSVDASASRSADGRRIVVKAVNYEGQQNTLFVRLQGEGVPEKAITTLHTINAGLKDAASLEHPDAITRVSRTMNYSREFALKLEPWSVAVIEIRAA